MKDKDYTNVILEEMRDKFAIVLEGIASIQEQLKKKADKTDLDEIRDDIKVIKFSIKRTNAVLRKHNIT